MDMAYNMERHTTPESTTEWLQRWSATEFGASVSDAATEILNKYGILTARRKYELLSELPFAFSTVHYDEAERNLADWNDLLDQAQSVYDSLDDATQISFFQLILHPILAGKTVVELYTKTAQNQLYFTQGRASTNLLAQQVRELFAQDADITDRYHDLNGGKWNHFVDQVHLGYTSWNDPVNNTNILPALAYIQEPSSNASLGVAIQGSATAFPQSQVLRLRSVDPFLPSTEKRYIDVFARKNGTFDYLISSNASYVAVSDEEGSLTAPGEASESRSFITIDWDDAPDGLSYAELIVTASDGAEAALILPVNKTSVPADFHGFVESNGVISIEAGHYTSAESKKCASYVEIPHYGRVLSGVKPWPLTIKTQTPETGPALSYSFYATSSAASPRLIISLGASHNHDPTRLIKYAYSIDGAAPVTVQPVSTTPPYREDAIWRKAIVENGWTSTINLEDSIDSGEHELKVWLLEPGAVLQKVALDLGGYQATALGPPESVEV